MAPVGVANTTPCRCLGLLSILLLYIGGHLVLGMARAQQECPDACRCERGRVTCDSEYGLRPMTEIPKGIPNDTTALFVGYNDIQSIGLELKSLTLLQILDVSSNVVNHTETSALRGLKQLVSLVLGRNRLSMNDISSLDLRDQQQLRFLDLSSNNLGPSLPGNVFLPLRRLQTLLLEGNKFVTISPDAFLGISQLQTLILRDNELLAVPTAALQDLDHLEELDLSNNNLTSIEGHAFKGLASLKRLHLMGEGHLTKIRNLAFSDALALEVINIEKSRRLTSIERHSFQGLTHLRHVNFQENALMVIHEDLLPWKRLTTLSIFDNPWRCDCHLEWMAEVVNAEGLLVPNTEETTCGSPDHLAGHVIGNIPEDEFSCPNEENTSVAIFAVIPVVAVTCLVTVALTILGMKLWQKIRRRGLLTTRVTYGGFGTERLADQTYGSVGAGSTPRATPSRSQPVTND